MAEVCGKIRGDVGYTRTVLTFFSLLPTLLARIENPNKHWLTRQPTAAAINAACAAAMKHITEAINASITADALLLKVCNPRLIDETDGISISWPAIVAFFEENPYSGTSSTPVTVAKSLAVGYALIRMMCADFFGSSEVIEYFRRTFVADAETLSGPTTIIKYRSAFHMHAGAAIAAMKTKCTAHPRLINFANDKITAGAGSLHINRFPQSGGGGMGGKNAGSAASYAAVEEEDEDEEETEVVAGDPLQTAWRDCTMEYAGPNKLDRDNICIIKMGVDAIIKSIKDTLRAIGSITTSSLAQKNTSMDELIASITTNNPVIAKIAAKMFVRADRTQERFDEFKGAFVKILQIFTAIKFSARNLSRKMYSTNPDTNARVFSNYNRDIKSANAAAGGGGAGAAGTGLRGGRRSRRQSRRARKTRRHQ